MQQRMEDIAARRLAMVVEQYVEARRSGRDHISTEQASRAIRQILKSAPDRRELDDLVASCAIRNGLAVVFDSGVGFPNSEEIGTGHRLPAKVVSTASNDVVDTLDAILGGVRQGSWLSAHTIIAALRQHTGTTRSDADLEGLIKKKMAEFGLRLCAGG